MASVRVATGRPYEVFIESGAGARLADLVAGASRVAIIHPDVLTDRAVKLAADLAGNTQVLTVRVPNGEPAKSSPVLVECWNALLGAGFTRNDVVVGFGGGATTDLAGFVAATLLRGVRYVAMPTTVLAMVDAAVGGKTGINVPAGKNLVGAFWEPGGVLCDLDLLIDLPPAEVSSGLAEVVKAGFSHDPRILELVEQDPGDARDVTSVRFSEIVRRAIEYKAEVVAGDLRESTSAAGSVGREALNYGHTLAHAIEAHHHFSWRHGEAVSVGMVFMAEVSHRLLGLDADALRRHRDVLSSLELPTTYDAAGYDELREIMGRDKKARGSRLRVVGLTRIGHVELIEGPDEQVLREAFATLHP